MKFTIVTISFNQGRYLQQTIQSVVEQTGIDLEYVVVDAGSTDGSREIIAQYRNRIARVILEPDDGPADGLNKGFANASGDVLGFVNASDFLLPEALAKVANFLTHHKHVEAVTGDLVLVDDDGVITRRASSPTAFSAQRFAYYLCHTHQQSTFFRRRAFLLSPGFNPANRTSWDAELFVDMSLAGVSFVRLREPLAAFRLHDDRISIRGELAQALRHDRDRLFARILKRPPDRWFRLKRAIGSFGLRTLSLANRALVGLSVGGQMFPAPAGTDALAIAGTRSPARADHPG